MMLAPIAIALLSPQFHEAELSPRRPNIVVIIADDLAPQDLEAVETPSIDALAGSGTTFSAAFANPVCSPSRRSMMFGQWYGGESAPECGTWSPEAPAVGLLSFPEVMRGGGYSTGLFGKWHLGATPVADWEFAPMVHGFDTWRAGVESNVKRCGGNSYRNWIRIDDGESAPTTDYNTTAIRDAFLGWWAETQGPKFAVVSYQAPHIPFHAPPVEMLPDGWPTPSTQLEKFEAMIASLDCAVGDMMGVLGGDTWVVFMGDNGTPKQLSDRAKTTTFERGIHVPLIVSHPRLQPRESTALVHIVDLMATVADLAGLGVPQLDGIDSRSFRRSVFGPVPARDWVFCWTAHWDDAAVRTSTHKLRMVRGVEELYDLVVDPDELAALDLSVPANAGLRDRLRALAEGVRN